MSLTIDARGKMASHGFNAPSSSSGLSLYGGVLDKPSEKAALGSDGPAPETSAADRKAEDKPKAWSASLGFAPVVRKRPGQAKTSTPASLVASYNVATIVSAPKLINMPGDDVDGVALAEPTSATLIKAPALTLPEATPGEDVNGFKQTVAGKRAANAEKKGKRKRRRRNEEETTRDFSGDYDPARPNDYAEWKNFIKIRKAEEREARRREQEEEDYSSASDEDRRPAVPNKFFAPPTAFYAGENIEAPRPDSPPYQAKEDSPPFQSLTPPPRMPSPPPPRPRSPPPQPQSGEDAYARRMAMSAGVQMGDDAYARRATLSAPSTEQSAISLSADEAQARAKSIAERLSKMAGNAPMPLDQPSAPQPEAPEPIGRPDPHAFAAKLMAKYGWKQGQGLGASESGMLNPLTVEQQGPSKKPREGEGKAPVGFSSGRGTIVSDHRSAKEQSEKAKYGEPSRIILLRNVVGRNEVDDDLATEIGEEAGKHGFVERCKIHMMPFNTPDEQSVRIFVLFSGQVGAWNAVRELDGRHFGGRIIRATFFDEDFFARGAYGIGD